MTFSPVCLLLCIYHHTWHVTAVVLRHSPHFIYNRQFSMFTSSLSASETMMEKSQGGRSILSLRVTAAAWFNETVCQKAKQQAVNKQAEVTHGLVCAQLNRMQTDCRKLFFLSFFLPYIKRGKKKPKHMFAKVLVGLWTGEAEDSNTVSRHACSLHQAIEKPCQGQHAIQNNAAGFRVAAAAAAWKST